MSEVKGVAASVFLNALQDSLFHFFMSMDDQKGLKTLNERFLAFEEAHRRLAVSNKPLPAGFELT